jgi:hypothetical protein
MAPTSGDALEPAALEYGKTDHTVHHETKDPVNGDLNTLDAGYNVRLVPLLAVSGDEACFHLT